MDLVAGVPRIVVLMEHTSKSGSPKVLQKCTLPLTGAAVVHVLITDLAVFEVGRPGLILIELATSVTVDEVVQKTDAPITVRLGRDP